MKSLDLAEFQPTAEAEWREKIAADLAGHGATTTLLWEPEPELVIDAVATNTTLARAREQWPGADFNSVVSQSTSVQYVPLRADGRDDKRLRAAHDRSDLVLIEYRAAAISAVLQAVEDGNLSCDRIIVDCAAASGWTRAETSTRDFNVLAPDLLLPSQLPGDGNARSIDSANADSAAVTIDTRGLRGEVDAVVIECGAAAAAFEVHARRSPPARINVISPVGSKIFLEVAKLTALRALLRTRNAANRGSASAGASESSRVRIWAVAGTVGSSADRREHQIRLTYAAVAGMLGGANHVVTVPHSADPDDVALAANVPLILRHESDLSRAASPMTDSYYVGSVAAKIAAGASKLTDQLVAAGGLDTTEGRHILTDTIARHKSALRP